MLDNLYYLLSGILEGFESINSLHPLPLKRINWVAIYSNAMLKLLTTPPSLTFN